LPGLHAALHAGSCPCVLGIIYIGPSRALRASLGRTLFRLAGFGRCSGWGTMKQLRWAGRPPLILGPSAWATTIEAAICSISVERYGYGGLGPPGEIVMVLSRVSRLWPCSGADIRIVCAPAMCFFFGRLFLKRGAWSTGVGRGRKRKHVQAKGISSTC